MLSMWEFRILTPHKFNFHFKINFIIKTEFSTGKWVKRRESWPTQVFNPFPSYATLPLSSNSFFCCINLLQGSMLKPLYRYMTKLHFDYGYADRFGAAIVEYSLLLNSLIVLVSFTENICAHLTNIYNPVYIAIVDYFSILSL